VERKVEKVERAKGGKGGNEGGGVKWLSVMVNRRR
jgi:hypothetical protein